MLQTIGLLILTGLLWGCTNPFIRRGTRGLRKVQASTWLGQAKAEVTFLLSNWDYVVPWLVNQCGSVCYVWVVRRAALGAAAAVANGLAFLATALTGALTGLDRPLTKRSMMGIGLIVVGTALCCWDQTDS